MENAARRNDTRAMYKYIDVLTKPTIKIDEPLLDKNNKKVLNPKEKLDVWKDHFEKLLNAGKELEEKVLSYQRITRV